VALLSGGSAQEIHLARADGYSRTGNIYLGRVDRIVPGMQAAFVSVGLERPGFLHVRDIEGPRLMLGEEAEARPDIRELLHEGQPLMVQIAKDPISGKGARLTTQVAIASRYLVLMPFNDHIGISQRLDEEEERDRLKCLVEDIRRTQGIHMGFIVRTVAEGVGREPIDADVRVLARIWDKVMANRLAVGCPGLVYQELPLHIRVVRDLVNANVDMIQIDHQGTFDRVRDFVSEFLPEFTDRIVMYNDARPLFERYGVDDELNQCLARKVPLKSGGHLVIEQTEAMITVDVNTGRYVGTHSLEETVYRTNLEAASAVPRQLRLRNLGGIIVIDFIDMEESEHQRQVLRALEKACDADPAKIRVEGFSSLGLVQMSRKRTRESLLQQVCEPCRHCDGMGMVKTAETTSIEVLRAIIEDAQIPCDNPAVDAHYMIRASEPVVHRLLDEDAEQLAGLARLIGCEVRMQVEPSYGPGQFDISLV
ncbi:MAG: Rne/Rng family ribonuclease, partial [Gammaproteobacteria bacterium]|nr:Rne/Rng family ribonuclease [Gammaproteobacteria bacterium]